MLYAWTEKPRLKSFFLSKSSLLLSADEKTACSQKPQQHDRAAPLLHFICKEIPVLHEWAEKVGVRLVIAALPGTFAAPDRALAYIYPDSGGLAEIDYQCIIESFEIGKERLFEDDPRFGLVVLSEIVGRALSPAVNDPGTAISIIGTFQRLFTLWNEPAPQDDLNTVKYDRIAVPELSIRDMFDDAFTSLARDGAGVVEVSIRLQKAFHSLASLGDSDIKEATEYHANLALKRAEIALDIEEDFNAIKKAANR